MTLATDILGPTANPADFGAWWERLEKDPLKEDYQKIAVFLREGVTNAAFRMALIRLNVSLAVEIKQKVLSADQRKRAAISYIDRRGDALAAVTSNANPIKNDTAEQAYRAYAKSKDKKNGFSKLLSNVLANHEKAQGFASTVPTILKFLSPDQFRDIIKGGSQFKDPGAQSRHGEFTHRIHWYLICHGLKGKLSTKPLNIFQAIGQYPEAFPRPEYQFTGLWDALFDRLEAKNTTYGFVGEGGADAAGYGTDFRCPEWLNMYLVDSDAGGKSYPLLSSILRARMNKRRFQAQIEPFMPPGKGLTENDSASLQYLANKLEKKMFLELGFGQQAVLVDFLLKEDSI